MPSPSGPYWIEPPQAPFPTCRNLPFQPDIGSQISDLMSESLDGLIVSATRQNAGRLAAAAAPPPPGGTNLPAATGIADVTVEFGSLSEAARRSHAAADTDDVCACADEPTSRTDAKAIMVFIVTLHGPPGCTAAGPPPLPNGTSYTAAT